MTCWSRSAERDQHSTDSADASARWWCPGQVPFPPVIAGRNRTTMGDRGPGPGGASALALWMRRDRDGAADARRTAEPAVGREQRAVERLRQGDVRGVVARQVASQLPHAVEEGERRVAARPASKPPLISAVSTPRSGSAPSSAGLSALRETSASSRIATALTEVASCAARRSRRSTTSSGTFRR